MAEYAFILALVAIVAATAFAVFGQQIIALIDSIKP